MFNLFGLMFRSKLFNSPQTHMADFDYWHTYKRHTARHFFKNKTRTFFKQIKFINANIGPCGKTKHALYFFCAYILTFQMTPKHGSTILICQNRLFFSHTRQAHLADNDSVEITLKRTKQIDVSVVSNEFINIDNRVLIQKLFSPSKIFN